MGQEGGKIGIQASAREAQGGPKMGLKGGPMVTQRARKVQEGPKLAPGAAKKGSKVETFFV